MDKEDIKELNKWQPIKVFLLIFTIFGALWFALEILEKLDKIIWLMGGQIV